MSPMGHRRALNGRKWDSHGILRLYNGCSTDHAREWHQVSSGGWLCDQCWKDRFD
jgi:hypothetical protein